MTTREFKQWQEKAKIYGFYGGQLNVFLSPKGFKSIKNPCDYIIKLLDNKLYDYFWFPFSKNELTIDGNILNFPIAHAVLMMVSMYTTNMLNLLELHHTKHLNNIILWIV